MTLRTPETQPDLFSQPETRSYFNTVPLEGERLKGAEMRAMAQEEIVLEFLKTVNDATPEEIWLAKFSKTRIPVGSIRRACSNLSASKRNKKTNELIRIALIEKSGNKRMGFYDTEVNAYKLK